MALGEVGMGEGIQGQAEAWEGAVRGGEWEKEESVTQMTFSQGLGTNDPHPETSQVTE